jgi:hypothetical protein
MQYATKEVELASKLIARQPADQWKPSSPVRWRYMIPDECGGCRVNICCPEPAQLAPIMAKFVVHSPALPS